MSTPCHVQDSLQIRRFLYQFSESKNSNGRCDANSKGITLSPKKNSTKREKQNKPGAPPATSLTTPSSSTPSSSTPSSSIPLESRRVQQKRLFSSACRLERAAEREQELDERMDFEYDATMVTIFRDFSWYYPTNQMKEDRRDEDYCHNKDTSTVEIDSSLKYCFVNLNSLVDLFRLCIFCQAMACAIHVKNEVPPET